MNISDYVNRICVRVAYTYYIIYMLSPQTHFNSIEQEKRNSYAIAYPSEGGLRTDIGQK